MATPVLTPEEWRQKINKHDEASLERVFEKAFPTVKQEELDKLSRPERVARLVEFNLREQAQTAPAVAASGNTDPMTLMMQMMQASVKAAADAELRREAETAEAERARKEELELRREKIAAMLNVREKGGCKLARGQISARSRAFRGRHSKRSRTQARNERGF
jgi:Zn-dependent oligopeptidase